MINRILIRIKVVQILYSYLLSRSEFTIEAAPQGEISKERRFAYSVYLDILYLIQELSGVRVTNPGRKLPELFLNPKLKENRVGEALSKNLILRETMSRELSHLNTFAPILQKLAERIQASSAFLDYSRKRKKDLAQDVALWVTLLETTILKDPDLTAVLRQNEDFSLNGLHHGIMMAVDTLREYNDSRASEIKARQDLENSLQQAYRLYYALLNLIVELTQEELERQEFAKSKYIVSSEDLNPNRRFVDNRLAAYLRENPEMEEFRKDKKNEEFITWIDSAGLLKKLLDLITESDIYKDYMARESSTWAEDCEFWRDLLKSVILTSDDFDEAMERKSIFWNDDLGTMGTFVLKTLRRLGQTEDPESFEFLPKYKDTEDEEFGMKLFNAAVENREEYRRYIDSFIKKDWDPDRLAFMDIVIMIAAIAEILNFPGIPVPVSLNEYIEIANNYSTRRSGSFINGILYAVVSQLAEDGRLNKPFTRK